MEVLVVGSLGGCNKHFVKKNKVKSINSGETNKIDRITKETQLFVGQRREYSVF